ncbi:hypothetical protein O181_049773 [Austropuccinia psidii MF-1]|uniref:Uncharacterized protein n=1 Tax=Austropuccinia psidii MF-1 TaxID=1389203 RepID=A0A9Q3E0I6_9BASI|nr:hypothetical protein [Austropuccinia psidii MF-1]
MKSHVLDQQDGMSYPEGSGQGVAQAQQTLDRQDMIRSLSSSLPWIGKTVCLSQRDQDEEWHRHDEPRRNKKSVKDTNGGDSRYNIVKALNINTMAVNLVNKVVVILNASTKTDENTRQLSPFVYRVVDPPTTSTHSQRPHSPGPSHPWHQSFDGVANPDPCQLRERTLEERPPSAWGSWYQRERVSRVQFVEHHAADKVFFDSSASIHLSGSAKFANDLGAIHPFCIFFADSNSSITITQMATLRILVRGGLIFISDVASSNKVLGTVLSMGRLCREGVFLGLVA